MSRQRIETEGTGTAPNPSDVAATIAAIRGNKPIPKVTSSTETKGKDFPPAGTIVGTKRGPDFGTHVNIIADGTGGTRESKPINDEDTPNSSSSANSNFPTAGKVLGTRRGSKPGFRIDLIADGKGGYTESADIADEGSQYGTPTVIPGSTGGTTIKPDRTLASDTFANTFALMFGQNEAVQPYVKQLYNLVGGFYKSGSSIDESLNLALHEAYTNNAIPDFTKRFKGLFDLQALALSGKAVQVPTIAEFIHAENQMGDILRSAGMGDLATQDYLGQVIGHGKSVKDVTDAIVSSFNAIDNSPQDIKDTLASQFPMLDRTTLAKSLLMGADGAAEIQKKIDLATTVTAASKQNVLLTDAQKQLLAQSGLSYNQQLKGLGNVSTEGQRGQVLSDIYGKTVDGFGQDQAFQDQFQGLASADRAKRQVVAREQANWQGSSGTLGPSYGTPRSSFNLVPAGQI